jgi:hypothetical protein
MPLGRSGENDFSRRQLALNSHFYLSYNLNIRIQRGLKSSNLRLRISVRYHFLPLVKIKNNLGNDEKVMFLGFLRLCKLNSRLSTKPKIRFRGGTKSDVKSNIISVVPHF